LSQTHNARRDALVIKSLISFWAKFELSLETTEFPVCFETFTQKVLDKTKSTTHKTLLFGFSVVFCPNLRTLSELLPIRDIKRSEKTFPRNFFAAQCRMSERAFRLKRAKSTCCLEFEQRNVSAKHERKTQHESTFSLNDDFPQTLPRWRGLPVRLCFQNVRQTIEIED
jgi:hypothetical protein